ncbi:MAG TPA: outer membrane protein transport protein [bacterium]|nr:outer membrane protein transport protein [bacterium]
MKWSLRGMFTLLLLLPIAAFSQTPDTSLLNTAPPSPVGSGARAMGTGGAFIAIADDATAATWNPAGLTQLVFPEAGLAYTYEDRDIDGDNVYFRSINYLSVVYPFSVGEVNVATSLNFQRLYDFSFENNFDTFEERDGIAASVLNSDFDGDGISGPYVISKNWQYDSTRVIGMNEIMGEVGAVSPAVAIQVTPQFSLGFTYNLLKDGIVGPRYENTYEHTRAGTYQEFAGVYVDNSSPFCTCNGGKPCNTDPVAGPIYDMVDNPSCMDMNDQLIDGTTAWTTPIDYTSNYQSTQKISLSGHNFNVGLLWKATPRVTIGAVYRSEFEAKIEREQRINKINSSTGATMLHYKFDEMMRFPASYGVGAAFRYSDALSIALDVSRIEWDRFVYHYEHGKYNEVSPVNGAPVEYADIDPTMTYRLGAEYLVIQPGYVVPIRGGFFYDPEPAAGAPDDYYGVAVGTGLARGPLILDLTYWYRWGNDVTLYSSYDPKTHKVKETRGDITRQMLMLSAVVHME